MNNTLITYFGYIASFIVLISFTMNSVLRLRWINLVGASLFAIYGFLIGSIPTGLMNTAISLIDIFYLVKFYKEQNKASLSN